MKKTSLLTRLEAVEQKLDSVLPPEESGKWGLAFLDSRPEPMKERLVSVYASFLLGTGNAERERPGVMAEGRRVEAMRLDWLDAHMKSEAKARRLDDLLARGKVSAAIDYFVDVISESEAINDAADRQSLPPYDQTAAEFYAIRRDRLARGEWPRLAHRGEQLLAVLEGRPDPPKEADPYGWD